MKVLVTGNQGYIGTVLTQTLQSYGIDVLGLDTGLFADCVFGELKNECKTIPCDIRNVSEETFSNVDAVVHLAAISNDPLGYVNSSLTKQINFDGALHVAQKAKNAGVQKFIFASSCSLYGLHGDNFLNENAEFNPVTPYGESKVLAESGISNLADSDFSPTFLRNGTLFGYSPRLRGDLAINNLTGYAYCINKVLLNSDGQAWRPFIHIQDVCEAIITVLKAPRELVSNEAFNIVNDKLNVQVMDVVNKIKDIVPNCVTSFGEGSGADKRNYKVTGAKMFTKLGFSPSRSIEDGIIEIYNAYRRYGLTIEQLESRELIRLKQLQYLIANSFIDGNFNMVLRPSYSGEAS